jgi:hypothetical protein
MERVAQRDEAWLQRRPHEPGYVRPEVTGEFPNQRPSPDAFEYVERTSPDEMHKHQVTREEATEC